MLKLNLRGADKAIGNLRKAVSPMNDARIGDNAIKALEPVAEEARRLVPVDTGGLRNSIAISNTLADARTDGKRVYVGPAQAGVGNDDVYYGHFIEFGTVKQRAQPFLAPAVHKHRDLVMEVLSVKIGDDMVEKL